MTKEEMIAQAKRIIESSEKNSFGALAEAKQFLKTYAGSDNNFLKDLEEIKIGTTPKHKTFCVQATLVSFIGYVDNGLLRSISLEREIQIETVSDYLEQAETFLNDSKFHPAAPAVIIGASLEEFLRNWLEEEGIDLSEIKNSLSSFATQLRKLNKINKQDLKDITSWGGIRNDAAHGHWDNLKDIEQIKIMLAGVNLFMRKYSEKQV